MNKRCLLLLLLPLANAWGQTPQTDSLLQVLQQSPPAAQELRTRLALGEAYLKAFPPLYDDAIAHMEEALPRLQPHMDAETSGDYYYLLGEAYYNKDSYESDPLSKERSPHYYREAIHFLSQGQDSVQLANALLNAGTMLMFTEKGTALAYFENAADIFAAHDEANRLATTYGQLSGVLASLGKMDQALAYSGKALEILPQLKDQYAVAQICINLGLTFLESEQHHEATQLLEEALKAAEKEGDSYLLASTYMYLGASILDQQDPAPADLATAGSYLDQGAALYREEQQDFALAYLDFYYAAYFLHQQNYPQALQHSRQHIDYMLPLQQAEVLGNAYYQRGYIYDAAGREDSAAVYYTRAAEAGNAAGNQSVMAQAYERLYRLSKSQQQFDAALGFHEQYLAYHDSIYNKNLQDVLSIESTRVNLAGERRARQEAESTAAFLAFRNKLYLAIAIGLLVALSVIGFLFRKLALTRKQLETQNQQLTQLNATKDKFFGIISHDLRSPIAALDGVGEQMNYYLAKQDEGKLRQLAQRIDETTQRLSKLLDNLLNWALIQTGTLPYQPKTLDLRAISEEIVALYQPLADAKQVDIDNQIPQHTLIHADPHATHTILRNLLHNALKFTPTSGKVRLHARAQADQVFIEVQDTGMGIRPEKLSHLFEVERKSTPGTAGEKGSGLGLLLCKELATLNKGTIQASSKWEKGTTFVFSLPQSA